jgi:hypothetical protein
MLSGDRCNSTWTSRMVLHVRAIQAEKANPERPAMSDNDFKQALRTIAIIAAFWALFQLVTHYTQ